MTQPQKVLDALGDPTRRAIFEKIAKCALPVGEISKKIPVTRSAVSQHLKILKDAGLVRVVHEGTRNFYHLDSKGIMALRKYLDEFWGLALEAFKVAAEQVEKGGK